MTGINLNDPISPTINKDILDNTTEEKTAADSAHSDALNILAENQTIENTLVQGAGWQFTFNYDTVNTSRITSIVRNNGSTSQTMTFTYNDNGNVINISKWV